MKNAVKTLVLNVQFYTLFLAVSATLISLFSLMLLVSAPFLSRRAFMRRFRLLIKAYGKAVMALPRPLIRITFEQEETTTQTPVIYVCNHRSSSDPFLVGLLPGELIQVVNIWPFKIPVLGPLAKRAGYLSIREMPPEEFFERAGELLASGTSLVVFPEGTRSVTGEMGSFHGAAFRLAQRANVPIVPVCLTGSELTPPKGTLKLSPSHVRVRQLKALCPDDFGEDSPFKLKNRVHALIARETARMEACT